MRRKLSLAVLGILILASCGTTPTPPPGTEVASQVIVSIGGGTTEAWSCPFNIVMSLIPEQPALQLMRVQRCPITAKSEWPTGMYTIVALPVDSVPDVIMLPKESQGLQAPGKANVTQDALNGTLTLTPTVEYDNAVVVAVIPMADFNAGKWPTATVTSFVSALATNNYERMCSWTQKNKQRLTQLVGKASEDIIAEINRRWTCTV